MPLFKLSDYPLRVLSALDLQKCKTEGGSIRMLEKQHTDPNQAGMEWNLTQMERDSSGEKEGKGREHILPRLEFQVKWEVLKMTHPLRFGRTERVQHYMQNL